jgi:excisionase family DNA binding protein
MNPLPVMLTPHDVADILKVSYETALEFIKYSGIDYIKVGRQYRVSKDKLTAFLQKKGHTIIDLEQDR